MAHPLSGLRTLIDAAAPEVGLARAEFDRSTRLAAGKHRSHDLAEALRIVGLTALSAIERHPARFSSIELEALVPTLPAASELSPAHRGRKRRVLHVCTEINATGGHTRALWNWIRNDSGTEHHLALTHQQDRPVPAFVAEAVTKSGGEICLGSDTPIDAVALRVRVAARSSDLVMLHVHPHDLTPILAFAGVDDRPPIGLFNHADHLFGIGLSVADAIVDIRASGHALTGRRRGVAANRQLLLPLPLADVKRRSSRSEAKRTLGLEADQIVLLSIAADYKYRPLADLDFVSVHLPLLRRFPKCRMIVVGPSSDSPYWRRWLDETGGRVRAVGQTPDLAIYHEAADIYVESFPFGSLTALLEAALLETPAVTWGAFPADCGAAVLRTDDIALTGMPFAFGDHDQYIEHIADLIVRENRRHEIGRVMADSIRQVHTGEAWSERARRLYDDIGALAGRRVTRPRVAPPEPIDRYDLTLSAFLTARRNSS